MSSSDRFETRPPHKDFDERVQQPGRDRMFTADSRGGREGIFHDPFQSGHHKKPGKTVRG